MGADSPVTAQQAWRAALRPRFGLAGLLAMVTLAAVACWYWWRLPFVVEHEGVRISQGPESTIMTADWFDPPERDPFEVSGPVGALPPAPANGASTNGTSGNRIPKIVSKGQWIVRQRETLRRVWGGTIRHGPLVSYDEEGHKIAEAHYREGLLHGPSTKWFSTGRVREQGEYRNGRKHGQWLLVNQDLQRSPPKIGYSRNTSSWKDGTPNGKWEWNDADDNNFLTIAFVDGRFVGEPPAGAEAGLAKRLADGLIDNPDRLLSLFSPVAGEFNETPLKDAVVFLAEASESPILLDAKSMEEAGINIDADVSESIQPGTPLVIALDQVLRPHNLVCDYRYGSFFITTQARFDAGDLTGISQIKPRVGSPLDSVWNSPVDIEFLETPLPDALNFLIRKTDGRLTIDTTRLPKKIRNWPLTNNIHDLPLRHALGILFEGLPIRCRLEGDVLVLEEQPSAPPGAK